MVWPFFFLNECEVSTGVKITVTCTLAQTSHSYFFLKNGHIHTLVCILGYIVSEQIPDPRIGIILQGAFLGEHFHNLTDNYVFVYVQLVHMPQSFEQNTSKDMNHLYYAAEVSLLQSFNVSLYNTIKLCPNRI